MTYDESHAKSRIRNSIIYNSIVFLIFLLWFSYSTFDNVYILFLICFIIFLIVTIKYVVDRRYGFFMEEKILYILLFLIPFSLFVNILIFYQPFSPTFFIPFYSLVGIKHNHNFIMAFLYFSVIMIKLIGIKVYFSKNVKILKEGRGDEIFQYFTRDLNYKKIIFAAIFLPLVAFVEELIYRSFLLSFLTYYLNWHYILSIAIVSIIFGLVHYSTSQNWGHVLSTLISSVIYSLALIHLGILYPWIFHLSTNLFVLLFYYQGRKKIIMQKSPLNSLK